MIHPFKDGNGRVGRLLIPLYLFIKGSIPYPVFFISVVTLPPMTMNIKNAFIIFLKLISVHLPHYQAWEDWISFFPSWC